MITLQRVWGLTVLPLTDFGDVDYCGLTIAAHGLPMSRKSIFFYPFCNLIYFDYRYDGILTYYVVGTSPAVSGTLPWNLTRLERP